ncbi:hypothetical protein CGC20_22420 [Leishmania donovani]|uniref:Uncharacterized protein n=1 Tax=Leishmania donovani TaxID=5661 RepID=A0A504Y1Y2_LEIDO|nr:hypothetical protein CGC20_22420 [Leishmania donovani]
MTTSAATQDNNLVSPQRHHQQQNNDFDLAVIDASNSCQAHGGDENANGGAARSGSAVSVHRARSSSTLQAATDSAVPLPLRTLLILEDAHPAATKVSTAPTPAGGHTRGTVSMRRGGDTEVDMNEHNTDSSQVCRAISPSTLNPKGRVPLESPAFSCPPSTAAPPLPVGRAARSTNAPCHPSTTTTSTATPQRPDEPLDLGVKGAVDRGSGNSKSGLKDVEAKTVYKRTSPAQRAHDVPSTAPAALATQPRSSASSPFPAVAAAATATGLAVSRPPTSSMTAQRVSAFQPSDAAGHSVGRTTVAPTVDDARSPASDSKSPRGAEDVSGPRPSGKECGEALPRGLPVSIETPHFLQLVPGEQAGHQGSEESDSTTPTDTNSAPILPPDDGFFRGSATPATATDNTSLFSDDDHDNGQDSNCVTAAASPSVYYSFHQQPRQLKAPGVPGAGLSSTTTVTDTTARVSPRSPFVSPLTAVVAAESGGSAAAAAFPSSAATTDACLRGRRSVSQSVIIAAWNRMGARTGAPVSGVGAGGGHHGGVESPEPSAEALQMSFALRKSLAVAGDSIGGGDELATSAVPASRDTQLARVPTGAAAEVATGKASFFRHQCTVAGHQEAGSRGSSRRSWASVASILPIRRRSVVTRQREPPALFSPSPENSEPSDAVPQPFSALGQLSIREGAPAAGHPASPPAPTKAANDIAHSWVAAPPQELHRPPRARIKYKKEAPSADRALPLMREPPASLRTSTATSTAIATQWPSSQESRGSDTSLSTTQSLQAGILVPVNGEDRSGGGLVEERERLSEDRANEEGDAAERQAAPRSPQSLPQHQLQRQPIEEHPHRASAPGGTFFAPSTCGAAACGAILWVHSSPSSPRSYSTSDSRLEVARGAQDVEDEEDSIDEVGLRRARDGEDARCRLHRSGDEHAKHFVGLDASPFNRNYSSPSVFAYRSDSTGFNAMTAATRGGGGAKRAALVRSSSHQLLSRRSQSEPTRNTSLLSSTARAMPRWRERLTPTPQPTSLLSSSTARDDVDGTASGLLSAPRGRRGLTSQGAPPLAHQPSAHLHPPPPPTSALPSHVPQYLRREISGSLGSVRWQEVSLHASGGRASPNFGFAGSSRAARSVARSAKTPETTGAAAAVKLAVAAALLAVAAASPLAPIRDSAFGEHAATHAAAAGFDPSTPSEQGIPPSRTGTRTFADAIVRLPQTRYEPPMPSNRNTFTAFVHLSDISSSQLLATAAATFQCGFDAHLRGVSSGVHGDEAAARRQAHLAAGSGVGADVVDAAGGALPISPLNSSLGTAPTDHISRVDTPVLVAVHGAVARRTPLSEEAEAASARSESPDALSCVTPPKLRSVTKAPRGLNHAAAAVAAAAVGLDGSSGGFDGDNDAGSDDLSVPAAQPGATSPRTSWSLESMRAGGAPVSEGERHALSDEERPWLDAFGHSTPLLHSVAARWSRWKLPPLWTGSDTMDFSQRGGESGNGGGGHSPYSSVSVNSALVVVPGGRAASLASPATPTGSVAITGPPLGHTLHPGGGAVASVSFWMSGCRLRREAQYPTAPTNGCRSSIEAGAAPVAKHTSHDHDGDNAGLSDALVPPTLSFIEEAEVQSTCNASPLALAIAATSGGPYRGEGEPTPDKEALDDGVDGDERSGPPSISVSNTIAAPTNTAVTAALDGLGETETYARTCIEESAADARDAGVSVRDTLQTQHGQPPLQQQCSPTTAPFALPSALPGMGMVESGASHAIEGFAAGAGRDSGSCGGSGTTGVASCDSLVPPSQTASLVWRRLTQAQSPHELPHSPLATKLIGSDLMAEPHATSHRSVDIRSAGLAVGVDQRDTSLGEQIPLTVPQNSPEPSQPTASCTVGPPGSPDHVLARSPLLLGEEASVDTRAASRAQTRPDHHYGLVVSPSPHHEGSTPRVRAQSRSQRQHRGPSVGQERRIEKAAKRTAQTLLREGRVTEAVALLKSAGVYVQ